MKELNRELLKNSEILLIDMQEKLIKAMPESINSVITKQKILLQAAELLDIPVTVTEQYPKGLGYTIEPLKELLSTEVNIFF